MTTYHTDPEASGYADAWVTSSDGCGATPMDKTEKPKTAVSSCPAVQAASSYIGVVVVLLPCMPAAVAVTFYPGISLSTVDYKLSRRKHKKEEEGKGDLSFPMHVQLLQLCLLLIQL